MIISVINQKGGVGKTTSAVNLGSAFAEIGYQVTMVDLDLQRDLMSFSERTSNLQFVPATVETLTTVVQEIASVKSDSIAVIDCPPALGTETAAALKISDLVVIPVQAQYLALRGLARIIETIRAARHPGQGGNLKLKSRVLITMFDTRAKLSHEVDTAARASGTDVFETTIPNHLIFTKASLAHQSVLQYAPRSAGAQAYRDVVKEITRQHPATS